MFVGLFGDDALTLIARRKPHGRWSCMVKAGENEGTGEMPVAVRLPTAAGRNLSRRASNCENSATRTCEIHRVLNTRFHAIPGDRSLADDCSATDKQSKERPHHDPRGKAALDDDSYTTPMHETSQAC